MQPLNAAYHVALQVQDAQPRAQAPQQLDALDALLVQGHLLQRAQQALVVLGTLFAGVWGWGWRRAGELRARRPNAAPKAASPRRSACDELLVISRCVSYAPLCGPYLLPQRSAAIWMTRRPGKIDMISIICM